MKAGRTRAKLTRPALINMARKAAVMLVLAFLAMPAANAAPFGLRVDFAVSSPSLPTPFVSLDAITGMLPNATLTWQLPMGATQNAYSVTVSTSSGSTAWASGVTTSQVQLAYFPRAILAPESKYTWAVAVRAIDGTWETSAPSPFFTSASPATWAATAPIWAAPCGWNGSVATPAFARFAASPLIPAPASGVALDVALVYATGAPPSYNDKITKLLGGYSLFVSGVRIGVGPGRNACGPIRLGPCK